MQPSGAASNWWLRSPSMTNATNFYNVNTSGWVSNNNASNANRFSPIVQTKGSTKPVHSIGAADG